MFGGVRGAHREAIARYFPALAPLMGVEPPANASTDSVTVLRQVVSSSARAVSASSGEASAAAIRGANLEPLPWTRHAGVDPRQLRLWPDELREELAAQAGQTDAVAAAREKLQQQHEFLATGIPEYNMSMARDDAGDSAAGERGGEKTRGEGAAKWDHNRAFCSAEQAKRFEFVKQIAWYDLGLTQPRKSIFWVCILSFALALWLRIYVHYHAQYLWLSALGAPIYAYTPYWHTVLLKYDSASLSFEAEAALVLIGPAACVAIGGVAMVVALLWHRFGTSFEVGPFTLGHVPADYSRFSAMWIAVTVLDPLLILLVDFATKNFNCFSRAPCDTAFATAQCTCAEGDAFKLVRLVFARIYIRVRARVRARVCACASWFRSSHARERAWAQRIVRSLSSLTRTRPLPPLVRALALPPSPLRRRPSRNRQFWRLFRDNLSLTGSADGFVGIAITGVGYAGLCAMTLVIGYYYLLHVHMGGRMLDLYRRLHSPASHFFIPHDYEVSARDQRLFKRQAPLRVVASTLSPSPAHHPLTWSAHACTPRRSPWPTCGGSARSRSAGRDPTARTEKCSSRTLSSPRPSPRRTSCTSGTSGDAGSRQASGTLRRCSRW